MTLIKNKKYQACWFLEACDKKLDIVKQNSPLDISKLVTVTTGDRLSCTNWVVLKKTWKWKT